MSASYQQFFNEVEAVAAVLDGYVEQFGPDDVDFETESFAAIWQAAELLARAHAVLYPLVALDVAKQALVLNDPEVSDATV